MRMPTRCPRSAWRMTKTALGTLEAMERYDVNSFCSFVGGGGSNSEDEFDIASSKLVFLN